MAKKPPKTDVEDDSPDAQASAKATASDKKLLTELRERYKKCVEHDRENRDKYRKNMRFALVPGEQWDKTIKKDRGDDRPMYEFNEIRIKGKAIVNQIRANRPSAKITPAEEGDVELAEAMKSQVDQIQNASDGDAVQDYAAHHQVFGGMGAERYMTAWQQDSVDQQDILIEPVLNPMCLYADYACQKQDKSDARFWIYATKLPKDVYKSRYPKAQPVQFDIDDDFVTDCDDDHVWIAEYWKQKPVTRKLALLSNGKTVDMATITALPMGVTVVKTRNAPGFEICQYICSGDAVLAGEDGEKEHPWAGKEFPFNIVYGEYTVIDGKVMWCGLPEYGKDAQRAHNWSMTSVFEAIASTPQGTTWVTADQANGLLPEWAEAQRKNIRIKRYNHDPKAPGPPVNEPPASIPTALVAAAQMSADALKASLGMPDSTLGETGKENSGVAIRRRQEAGAVANYNFGDNITNFMRRRVEILIDLIPKVKDTPYTLRVIGKDGAEKYVRLNEIDPLTGEKQNDLSALKYDLVVTQGPNFATQRQEAAETYMGLSQSNPNLQLVAGDVMFKYLDLPGAQEISERLKATLPGPIQQLLNKDQPEDPRVVAAMQQVQMLQQQLQEQAAVVQEETATAATDKAAADKAKADVQIAIANLKTQQAQMSTQQAEIATQVAQFQTLVANTEAKFATKDAADVTAKTTETADTAVADKDQTLTAVAEALQNIQQQSAEQVQALALLIQEVAAPKAKTPKTMVTERVNGGFRTVVTDETTGEQQVATSERNGPQMITRVGTVQ